MHRFFLFCSLVGLAGAAPVASAFPGFGYPMGAGEMGLNTNAGFLGVILSEVDAETVSALKLPAERGALIQQVAPDTPAATAGLEANDVVVLFNQTRVESAMQLQRMVRETPPGRTVPIKVVRSGEEQSMEITVGSARDLVLPGQLNRPRWNPDHGRDDEAPPLVPYFDKRPRRETLPEDSFPSLTPDRKPRLGVIIQPLGRQLSQFFGLEAEQTGVLVTSVTEDSAAEQGGVKAGDIILRVNGTSVATPQDVIEQVEAAPPGKNTLSVIRDKRALEIEVLFPEASMENIEDSI